MERKNCEITNQPFIVSTEEAEAYNYFGLPLPGTSPLERCRRQLSFKNDVHFFWQKCAATGKKIFSVFPPSTPFPVVCPESWFSGDWDGLDYGMEFDFRRLFIEQLLELWRKVPRPAYQLEHSISSTMCHHSRDVMGSTVVVGSRSVAACLYSAQIWDSSRLCDCYFVGASEECYECIDCFDCRRVRWGEFSTSCEECWFVSYCSDCRNCLFCSNLSGK